MTMRLGGRRASVLGAVAACAMLWAGSASGDLLKSISDVADFEARLNHSTSSYAVGPSGTAATLRVGFQSNFGSVQAGSGGINAIHFFKLPVINPGDVINAASLTTTLMPEASPNTDITPRFNADLYALGVIRAIPSGTDATTAASTSWFHTGGLDTRAGEGNLPRALIQDDFFVPFSSYESVNPSDPTVPGTPRQFSTNETANAALLAYILAAYNDPAFVNDGESYLVMRFNPDRVSGETGFNNDPVANGTTRYTMASGGSTGEGVVPPTLTLDVTVPEPGGLMVLVMGVVGVMGRRRG